MIVDPRRMVVYLPPWMTGAKEALMRRVAALTHRPVVRNPAQLFPDLIPLICCTKELGAFIREWQAAGRQFVYWDRGYLRRLGGMFTPARGSGYYRCHHSCFQMREIRDVPAARWKALQVPVKPWNKSGTKVVVATTASHYWKMHGINGENWLAQTVVALKRVTDRPIVVRAKDSPIPLEQELRDAHCLVAHGSNAAVEAVVLGCPVIVDQSSAAALVGRTSMSDVEKLVYPDREPWLRSLAHSQFTEEEMINGFAWRSL